MQEDRQPDGQVAGHDDRPGVREMRVLDDHCEHDRRKPAWSKPAHERDAAMNPEPPRAFAIPYASTAAARGMICRHASSIKCRARRFTREESENSTTASVASASVRTAELVGRTVRSSSTSGPTP